MSSRYRKANPLYALIGGSWVAIGCLIYLFARHTVPVAGAPGAAKELVVHCAAALHPPIEELARQYQRETGTPVRLHLGGSNTLLSQLEVGRQGDLYLAADESYVNLARTKGLVSDVVPLASMRPVMITAAGNPHGIQSVEDLLRTDIRIALANPDLAAMGKVTKTCFEDLGLWTALVERVQRRGVFKPTVSDVASDVALGGADAGIVWDAVARQFRGVEIVNNNQLACGETVVAIGVLESSTRAAASLHFAQFLAAPERGGATFRQFGYMTTGDNASLGQ